MIVTFNWKKKYHANQITPSANIPTRVKLSYIAMQIDVASSLKEKYLVKSITDDNGYLVMRHDVIKLDINGFRINGFLLSVSIIRPVRDR